MLGYVESFVTQRKIFITTIEKLFSDEEISDIVELYKDYWFYTQIQWAIKINEITLYRKIQLFNLFIFNMYNDHESLSTKKINHNKHMTASRTWFLPLNTLYNVLHM